jgi:putative membrane protein
MSLEVQAEFRRQPISAFGHIIFKTFVQIAKSFWPFFLYFILKAEREEDPGENFIYLILPTIILFKSLLDYFYFRFKITEDEVHVKSGIFSRKQTILPIHKIQTVHINQNWVQKIFNLSELSFDSPGSSNEEIKIQFDKVEAEELMAFILQKRKNEEETVKDNDQLISALSFQDLFKLGLTANHFETLIILVGLSLSFLNNIKNLIGDYEELMEDSTNKFMESGVFLIAMGLIAVLIISILVSLIRTIIAYLNFKITKNIQGLTINKGLINNSQKILPFKKMQYVTWSTNWLRKKISMYIFEFHTIGGVEVKNNLKIKAPITSKNTLDELAGMYFPMVPEQFVNTLRIDKSFWYRKTLINGVLPSLLLLFPLLYFVEERHYLVYLLILPLYLFMNYGLYRKKFRFSWTDEIIHIHSGIYGEKTTLLRWEKIQSVNIKQNLFQQSKTLANLVIHTAGGTVSAPYIPLEAARELQNIALYKVELNKSSWH